MKVNSGDFEATITQIIDGRSTTVEAPYVTDKNEWVLQVTGDKANELAQSLKTGDKVQISAELKIGSSTDPIKYIIPACIATYIMVYTCSSQERRCRDNQPDY